MSDMLFDIHFGKGNRKTGPIPTTDRPMTTCPATCPFLPKETTGGCYGTGRLFGNARKFASTWTVKDAIDHVNNIASRSAKYLRDRVVGDVVDEDGNLDRDYVAGISEVGRVTGLTVFGYTHAWKAFTPDDVAFINDEGYVMNASTETELDVLRALELGLPVVIVNEDLEDGDLLAGRRIVTCPAEEREDVTCATCGLCAKPNRTVIVRFHPHGMAAGRARRAIAAANARDEEAA